MTINLSPIEVKTGTPLQSGKGLTKPHTYLEALIQHWGFDQEAITLGTLYEGIRVDDIHALEGKGLHPLVSSGEKAYFASPQVAQQLKERLFPNQSDAVNYGSVVVSDAKTSTIQAGVRVLVVDDEAPEEEAVQQLQDLKNSFEQLGQSVDPLTLTAAIHSLGDSYALISPQLHNELALDALLQEVPNRLGNQRVAIADTQVIGTPNLTVLAEAERLEVIQPLLAELLAATDINPDTLDLGKIYQQSDRFEVQWAQAVDPNGPDRSQWQGTTVLSPAGESYRWTTFADPNPINGINQAVRDLRQLGNTPFQFRAGVFEWQGAMKGECRGSEYCAQLGVSAVIPRSSIKGDNKSIHPGVYEVDNLWWAYKEGAKVTKQRLGAQVLVNLPNGVMQDVLPQLEARAKALATAAGNPLSLAQLYVDHQERQQELFPDREPGWVYQLLKADIGANGPRVLLEHPAIVDELEKWVAGEWNEIATGGVEVPSAIAQPHQGLLEGEVCFPNLPDGARVCVYRSPLANVASMGVFINRTIEIAESDPEAFRQRGVVYLNPKDAKEKVIDFDGDRVAIIPEQDIWKARPEALADLPRGQVSIPALAHQQDITLYGKDGIIGTFPNHNPEGIQSGQPVSRKQVYLAPDLIAQLGEAPALSVGIDQYHNVLEEVIYLNQPERRPIQTEKETKIPRSPEHGFPTLAHAMLDAADNPTGRIADQGMRTQALYWDCQFTPMRDQPDLTIQIGEHLATLNQKYQLDGKTYEGDRRKEVPNAPTGYDFRAGINAIVAKTSALNAAMAQAGVNAECCQEAEVILGEMQAMLFQANGIVAVNLQRAVDTPKSARKPDAAALDFCQAICGYKDVEWLAHRKDEGLYREGTPLGTNTYDPIGWLVAMTNNYYRDCALERQEQVAYKELFKPDAMTFPDDLNAAVGYIARTYLKGVALVANQTRYSKTEAGLRAVVRGAEAKGEGRGLEIVRLLRYDKKGKSPLWERLRQEQVLNLQLVVKGQGMYPLQVQMQVKDNWQAIGVLGRESLIGAALDTLKQHDIASAGKLDAMLNGVVSHKQRKRLEEQLLAQVDLQDVCAQVNKGLASVTLQLHHTPTQDEAKAIRQQLNHQARAAIAVQVTQHHEELVMRAIGSCGAAYEPACGQRLVLKLMPDTVIDKFLPQSHTQEVQLIGMQHYEQSWDEQTPLTVRVSAIDIAGEYRSCVQIAQRVNAGTETETIEWQTIGLIAKDSYAPPIGIMGVGQLTTKLEQVIVHSPQLVELGFDEGLRVKCSDASVLTNQPQPMRFVMDDQKPAIQCNGTTIGIVNQTHRNQLKQQYGKAYQGVVDIPPFAGTIVPDRKAAKLCIAAPSIQLPDRWRQRHQSSELSPIVKERQMTPQESYRQATFLTGQGRVLQLLVAPDCHLAPFLEAGGTLPCRTSLSVDEATQTIHLHLVLQDQAYPVAITLAPASQAMIQQFEQNQGISLTNGKAAISGVLAPTLALAQQAMQKLATQSRPTVEAVR